MGWTSAFPEIIKASSADAFEMTCRKGYTFTVYKVSVWLLP